MLKDGIDMRTRIARFLALFKFQEIEKAAADSYQYSATNDRSLHGRMYKRRPGSTVGHQFFSSSLVGEYLLTVSIY